MLMVANWTFLTKRAWAPLCIAHDTEVRHAAIQVGITLTAPLSRTTTGMRGLVLCTWRQLDIAQPSRTDRELMAEPSAVSISLIVRRSTRYKRCEVIEIAQVRPARGYFRQGFSSPSPMR